MYGRVKKQTVYDRGKKLRKLKKKSFIGREQRKNKEKTFFDTEKEKKKEKS